MDLRLLEEKLGLFFQDPSLLQQALVHRSFVHENPDFPLSTNERLEFLGDALLTFVIGEKLYKDLPSLPEGDLTKLRAALVRRDTLAEVAAALGLGDYLFLGYGEERSGGRRRPANLARVYEAVVGAVLCDRGYQVAKRLVLRSLEPYLKRLEGGKVADDPKSMLQEVAQARGYGLPEYRTVGEEGPDHAKTFTVEVMVGGMARGLGSGLNKQAAEREAAQKALVALGDDVAMQQKRQT